LHFYRNLTTRDNGLTAEIQKESGLNKLRKQKLKIDERITDGERGMLSTVRRQRITEWIEEEGSARVRDLAKAFQVTEATIRQDLERLEKFGRITREHGGAFLNSVRSQVSSLALHHRVEMDRKKKSAGSPLPSLKIMRH